MMVPFDIVIEQGGSDSTQYSCEQLRNLFVDVIASTNRKGVHRFPGLTLQSSGSGIDRGDHVMANIRYVLIGTVLYKETSDGTRTNLGTVVGSDRAIFADDGVNLLFVTNGAVYRYNGSTLSTVTISSITGPTSIAYLNRTFIVSGSNGEFATSNVGDPGTWASQNQAEAETNPDGLTRIFIFNQLAYLLGERTTEIWYYSGTGNPPLDRQDTGLVNYGIAGKYAIANSNEYLYWLDDEGQPVQCIGSSARSIETTSIAYQISNLTTLSDCIVSAFKHRNQWFILFKFPTDGVDLVYSETYNYWLQLSSGSDRDVPASWPGSAVTYVYGKNYVTDAVSGDSYYLDADNFTWNDAVQYWQFVTRAFTALDIGIADPRRVICRSLSFDMQTGEALTTGQGSDPVLLCELSGDSGQTWDHQAFVETGVLGKYRNRVDFYAFESGYEIRARVAGSDPVDIHFYGGRVDLLDGGY